MEKKNQGPNNLIENKDKIPTKEPAHLSSAVKAYDNADFIHSNEGRTLRIISEYLYPEQYLNKLKIDKTIVFYGSARSLSKEEYGIRMRGLQDTLLSAKDDSEIALINADIESLKNQEDIMKSYEECVLLSKRLAEWSETLPEDKRFIIATGGGPGMMEAANRGAYLAGKKNIGFNISLPFEQQPNQYITPELNFEFHYFFMRKFWLAYMAQALVAMPGGFGTLDELFDILTLLQTQKMAHPIPIVLYNEEFWKNVVNFDFLVDKGLIRKDDLSMFQYANTPDEAFEYIKKELSEMYNL